MFDLKRMTTHVIRNIGIAVRNIIRNGMRI